MRAAAIPIDPPGPAGPAASRGGDPEVDRLHRLINYQPTCLLRLGMQGVILAANDAALAQLAATELAQVWGREFTERILLDQRDRWGEFARHVREDRAASTEFCLLDLNGNTSTVLLNGVYQPGHPDGTESMIVAVRDLSGLKRLERALQAQAGVWQALGETRKQLEDVAAHRQRLLEGLAERDAELARMAAEHTSDLARIQSLAEEHQLQLLLRDRRWQQQVDALQREIEEARAALEAHETRLAAESSRLAELLDEALHATARAHQMVKGAGPKAAAPARKP